MDHTTKNNIAASIRGFSLPRYQDIPNVGLYLEQAVKYINGYLGCLGDACLTNSMVSNYVKKGLIDSPVKKQYSREQIAYLIFIAVAKSVISIEDLHLFIGLQKKTYPVEVAYDYFRTELENLLFFVFGLKDTIDTIGTGSSDEKVMLRNTVITVAHKVYLSKHFQQLHIENTP